MRLLQRNLIGGLIGLVAAVPLHATSAQPVDLPKTPVCAPPAHPTPTQTEGPFYKPNPPRRHNLASTAQPGERLILTGFVLTRNCRPVPAVGIDIWQADAAGTYDNVGFKLRGREATDDWGRYWFETIVPGAYPGRTRHIHVKIWATGPALLTTQLYFAGEQKNAADVIFDPALIMRTRRTESRSGRPVLIGRYDFVLNKP